MTVVPQEYTLHCVTTGYYSYNITLYVDNQPIYYSGGQQNSISKQLLHSSNDTYDNNVNITWNGQSVNGDQMYKCNVFVDNNNEIRVNRTRFLTVKGMYMHN